MHSMAPLCWPTSATGRALSAASARVYEVMGAAEGAYALVGAGALAGASASAGEGGGVGAGAGAGAGGVACAMGGVGVHAAASAGAGATTDAGRIWGSTASPPDRHERAASARLGGASAWPAPRICERNDHRASSSVRERRTSRETGQSAPARRRLAAKTAAPAAGGRRRWQKLRLPAWLGRNAMQAIGML